MKEINLKLTIDEANVVLNALGNLPFVHVQQLIGKIQIQAGQQLNGDAKELIEPKEKSGKNKEVKAK